MPPVRSFRAGLEAGRAVRGAEARRAVVAGTGGAEIAGARLASLGATTVAAAGDVEQRAGVAVRVPALHNTSPVAGQRVHAGDDRCGHAGAAEHQPVGATG